MKDIAIFGAGGFGLEVAMLIEQINKASPEWNLIGFFDDGVSQGKILNGYPVLGGIKEVNNWPDDLSLVLALGSPRTKKRVFAQVTNDSVSYPVLIHPSVIIGNRKFVEIGEGSIICAGTIITTNITIGRHVILNLVCTVGHETRVGDYSSFMPGCNISGEVSIGAGNFWGTGAKIINRKAVGNNVVIGAGSVVIDDIPDDVTAVGMPAKVIKENPADDGR